jgi:hypothetical protein
MNLSVQTTAQGGHLIVYVVNSNNARILTLRDNQQDNVTLAPGFTYRFEFHTWGSEPADYEIHASVNPSNAGFRDFNFARHYDHPDQDMGGFYFTLTPNI